MKLAKALVTPTSPGLDEQDLREYAATVDDHVQHPCPLQILNLRDNPGITDVGAKALGKALSRNETLAHLKMRGCGGITHEAQGFIA